MSSFGGDRATVNYQRVETFSSSSFGDISIPGGYRRQLPARTPISCSSSSTYTLSKTRTPTTATPLRTPVSTRTPGSTSSCLASSNVVLAIVEGRGMAQGEIGIASMDFAFPVLKVTQFSDSQSYVKLIRKLEIIQPATILLPNTLCPSEGSTNLLYETIIDNSKANISVVQRRYFSNASGAQQVKQLCLIDDVQTVQLQLHNKYYALSAAAALIKYAEYVQNVIFAPSSLKVDYVGCEQIMFIDSRTAKYLELVESLVDPEGSKTLYGVLNNTSTFGGMRLLRSNILQPPFDHATVTQRLLAVSELLAPEHEQLLSDLRSILSRWPEIGRIISLFVHKPCKESKKTIENRVHQFTVLMEIMELLPGLSAALTRCSSPIFLACRALLDDEGFVAIKEKVLDVLDENAEVPQRNRQSSQIQRTQLVKEGVNDLLDVRRQALAEIVSDINDYISQLSTKYNMPFRMSYSTLRGYHIQLPASFSNHNNSSENDDNSTRSTRGGRQQSTRISTVNSASSPGSIRSSHRLPSEFIKVSRFRSVLLCTTSYLISLNNRVQDAENEVLSFTNSILLVLVEKLRPFVSCLYKLAESVAIVDLLVSLTVTSLTGGCVCPKFDNILALKKCRHPILDRFMPQSVVANDAFAEPGSNFVVITGPNMAGKSTYLKQIALIQIMAQIGCFVPAEFATLRLTDRLFARLDTNDDIETNLSSFMLEVREVSYILSTVTPNSLIIIDEFARATSPEEAFGVSFAVSEELLMTKAFTFFATHYTSLTLLASMYPNVDCHCFDLEDEANNNMESDNRRLSVTHRLRNGVVQSQHYGLHLVKATMAPRDVIEEAGVLVKRIDALNIRQQRSLEHTSVNNADCATLRLASLLNRTARYVGSPGANENVFKERLAKLKKDFTPLIAVSMQN